METFRAVVSGMVQGVNFRHATAMRAHELSVRGYVRNLPSGDEVEVVARGSREQLDRFLDFLREGPPAAQVAGVDVTWEDTREGPFESFTIRR